MNLIIAAASIYTPVSLKRKKLEELVACTAAAFGCEAPRVQGLSYDELLRTYARFTATQAKQVLKQEGVIASDLSEEVSAGAEQEIATPRTPPLPGSWRAVLLTRSLRGASFATKQSRCGQHGDCFAGAPPRSRAVDRPARNDDCNRSLPLRGPSGRGLGSLPGASSATKQSWSGQQGRDLAEIRRRLYDGACRMGQDLRRAFRVANTSDALAAARVLYRALGIDLQAAGGGEIVVRHCYFSQHYSGAVCQVIAYLDEGLFAGLSNGGQLTFYQRITEGHQCCLAHFRASP